MAKGLGVPDLCRNLQTAVADGGLPDWRELLYAGQLAGYDVAGVMCQRLEIEVALHLYVCKVGFQCQYSPSLGLSGREIDVVDGIVVVVAVGICC